MKTATVTWINYYNYGTLLQAYSLQQYINDIGISNVILDDYQIINGGLSKKKKSYETLFRYILKHRWHPKKIYRRIKKQYREYKQDRKKYAYNESVNKCKKFKKNKLYVRNIELSTIREKNDIFDIYICGSDQIWSTLDKNFKGYYYLDFVNKKKISYAASVGANYIPCDKEETIKNWLQDFSAISVREKKTAEQLSLLTGKDVKWVCDPTFLYNESYWKEFCSSKKLIKEKYLLCYFLEDREWYMEYACKIASKLGLKIVLIPSREEFCEEENVYKKGVGPKEFVNLIYKSSFVLTDSYHGMLFSLNLKKQFLILQRFKETDEDCQNIRVRTVLEYLNLTERFINKEELSNGNLNAINYTDIELKIDTLRNESRGFLKRNL